MRVDLGNQPLSAAALGLAAAVSLCASAHAAVVTVDFDALDGGRNGINVERPGNFYNGGLGSQGTGPGPNFGITFAGNRGNAEPTVICNDNGLCDNPAAGNSLFVFGNRQNTLENPGVVIHIEGGFRGIVEFDASISNFGANSALLEIKTDLNNPSNIVGGTRFTNPDPNDDCRRLSCAFVHYVFDITTDPRFPDDIVAHDIIIHTDRADVVVIDKIVFHDLILPDEDTPPVAVAEPASALMFGAIGLVAAMLRRRRAG
jgi:hypothetical protein